MGKYLHVFYSRYVQIDQVVFDKITYAILTNRITDVKAWRVMNLLAITSSASQYATPEALSSADIKRPKSFLK